MSGKPLAEQLAELSLLSVPKLRAEWVRLHRSPAPPYHADLLIRGIAYRLQEKASGGLTPTAARMLQRYARQLETSDTLDIEREVQIKPGTRLVRAWGGKTHHVMVLGQGYLFEDRRYGSLTRIAHEITGAKWSGPRFFGLTVKAANRGAA